MKKINTLEVIGLGSEGIKAINELTLELIHPTDCKWFARVNVAELNKTELENLKSFLEGKKLRYTEQMEGIETPKFY